MKRLSITIDRTVNLMRHSPSACRAFRPSRHFRRWRFFGQSWMSRSHAQHSFAWPTTRQIFDAIRAIELKSAHYVARPHGKWLRELQDALMTLDVPVGVWKPIKMPRNRCVSAQRQCCQSRPRWIRMQLCCWNFRTKRTAEFKAAAADIDVIWAT